MTTTTNVNSNTSSSSSTVSGLIGGNGSVTDLFTTLLVAQIKNQDPLSPQDPSQMVSQLTQLSQMESLQGLASQASTSSGLLSSLQVLTLGGQVGSTVQVQASQIHVSGEKVETSFTLPGNSNKVQLVLTGADGKEQRIELGALNVGANSYTLDPAKLGLTNGDYQIRVENADGVKLPVEVAAQITGVRLTGAGQAVIQLGALGEFDPSAITQFKGHLAS
ncbi:MAG: flagellar basal body rod modification protein [Roseateles depolymerans]|uniref:Basal-body rod modification protein FlgD n=1 Tax=Roseateles depolymerans TaxID=76731 RepID=A0A2W5G129_9BURK|nr:MAG: flagellar basal body rod modification protein [Roseateles depolymerans]